MKRIYSGGLFEAKIGYCRAVVVGGLVHVAGTVGQGETVEEQCQSALDVIENALIEAGTSFTHIVRVTYMLPKAADFEACWPILSDTFGENSSAATMIECGLIDPKYKIEIEVTAILPS